MLGPQDGTDELVDDCELALPSSVVGILSGEALAIARVNR